MKTWMCVLTACALAAAAARGEDIVFPGDAGVLDVTKEPYLAVPDGKTDCTEPILRAFLDAAHGKGNIVYLPNGVYLVSDTITWFGRQTRHVLQGQSRDGAIIKLADRGPGYDSPARPKAVIWTGEFPPQRFRNAIRNVTVDTGAGNPGAIGIRFNASNQGQMNTVKIRSGDGAGVIGLDMGYTGDVGPLLVKDLIVEGFDVGLYTSHATAAQTIEHVTLRGQRQFGWVNDGQAVAVRNLVSHNAVPALLNKRGPSIATILGAALTGEGPAKDQPAVINEGGLYVRDLKTPGYRMAVRDQGGGGASEPGLEAKAFRSHPTIKLFPDTPDEALGLPVEETPDVPWAPPDQWVSVRKFKSRPMWKIKNGPLTDQEPPKNVGREAIADWTDALQQAIDSGATTVYFPHGYYSLVGTVRLRGNVRRVIGMESTVSGHGEPTIVLEDGKHPVVVVERFDWMYAGMVVRTESPRTIALKAITVALDVGPGGRAFVEDAVVHYRVRPGGRLWVRQLNTEYTHEARHSRLWTDMPWCKPSAGLDDLIKVHVGNLNDGGTVWVLGTKSEGDGTLLTTINGGRSEVYGGVVYANHAKNPGKRAFVVGEGAAMSLSVGEWVSRGQPFNLLSETRGGEERLLKPGMAPGRGGGSMVVLANAYPAGADRPAPPPAPAPADPLPPGDGKGLAIELFDGEFGAKLGERVGAPIVETNDPMLAGKARWSVRATGQLQPRTTGVHRFNTPAPGWRLLVGDTLALDTWRNDGRYRDAGMSLEAGQTYPVKFEGRGDGKTRVALEWRQPRLPGDADMLTQFRPRAGAVPVVTLSASTATLGEADAPVIVTAKRGGDTGGELTAALLPGADLRTSLVMRHAARGDAVPGRDYAPIGDVLRFAPGQDAVTLALQPISNKAWEPARTVALALAAAHDYDVAGGGVAVELTDDDAPPAGAGTGLRATYFKRLDFTEPVFSRVEPTVSQYWSDKVPDPKLIPRSGWSVRFEGELLPQFSETYRLRLEPSTYSAVRVWIGDREAIHFGNEGEKPPFRMGKHGQGIVVARVPLEAGRRYPIRVEYQALQFYSQHVTLHWSSPSQFEQPIPPSQLFPAPVPETAAGGGSTAEPPR